MYKTDFALVKWTMLRGVKCVQRGQAEMLSLELSHQTLANKYIHGGASKIRQ